MRDSERTLIERARSGDVAAFETLVAEHQDGLLRLVRVLARNADDAEDCLQEALLQAFKGLSDFRGDAAFSTWIYRITLNTSRNWLRSQARGSSARMATRLGELAREVSHAPEREIMERESREMTRRALCKLPAHYREALLLRHYQDMSYEQIADVLRVPIGTVRSRIAEARRLLLRALDALGYSAYSDMR